MLSGRVGRYQVFVGGAGDKADGVFALCFITAPGTFIHAYQYFIASVSVKVTFILPPSYLAFNCLSFLIIILF